MQLSWPDGSKHVEMLLRGITLISRDTVASEAGIFLFQPHDEPIARDFCQNRCGCHRDAVAVGLGLDLNRNRPQSPTEPVMRTIQNGYRRFVAFGYSFANLLGEFPYSASRGECQTLCYAKGIDLFVVGHADGPARNPRGHGLKKLLADFSEINLESANFEGQTATSPVAARECLPASRIVMPTATGPNRAPRPTSSMPMTNLAPASKSACSLFSVGNALEDTLVVIQPAEVVKGPGDEECSADDEPLIHKALAW